jgi:hypothetical protein
MPFLFFKLKFYFSQRYIANTIGAACNSRIPPATLQSVLDFVCVIIAAGMLLLKIIRLSGSKADKRAVQLRFCRQKEKDWLLLLHSYFFKNHCVQMWYLFIECQISFQQRRKAL